MSRVSHSEVKKAISRVTKRVDIPAGRKQSFFCKADRFLARYYKPLTIQLKLERAIVSFSFDDIPDNAAFIGAPILESFGARGTFYVAGNLCGGSFRNDIFASCQQISELDARGHEIGCHTFSHPDSQRLSSKQQQEEFTKNRAFLKTRCGVEPPVTHAYPYGSVGLLQKRGASQTFQASRGVRPGLNTGRVDLMQLFSVPLYDHLYSETEIKNWIDRAAENKAWLIFYSHDVAEKPSEQGSSRHLLSYAVDQTLKTNCSIMTVANAIETINSVGT